MPTLANDASNTVNPVLQRIWKAKALITKNWLFSKISLKLAKIPAIPENDMAKTTTNPMKTFLLRERFFKQSQTVYFLVAFSCS